MNKNYEILRKKLDNIPIIESHQHYLGETKPVEDPLGFMICGYVYSDCVSSAQDITEEKIEWLMNKDIPIEERFSLFAEIYEHVKHTSYAKSSFWGRQEIWGMKDFSLESILEFDKRQKEERNQELYEKYMQKHKIVATICNIDDKAVVEGDVEYSKYCRFVVGTPGYHNRMHTKNEMQENTMRMENRNDIVTLDEYIACMDRYFKKCFDAGFVGIKDQAAYQRSLDYAYPCKADAEKLFNKMVYNPRLSLSEEEMRPLDDYLFHQIIQIARKYNKIVQIHTGHMAGVRNEITKTNAVQLTPILELYQDVKFDLFHGNWPYMGEFLYLGKNYPNAYLDMCWVQSIDPVYCIEFIKRAVMTVPQNKIFAHGGDCSCIEDQIGYAILARDTTAKALAELVDCEWLTMDEAEEIAKDMFYNNPNDFFELGFDRI